MFGGTMIEQNTLHAVCKRIENLIAPLTKEETQSQVKMLLCHALNLDLLQILAQRERILTTDELCNIYELVERRLTGEPLQYILGSWDFFGLEFFVDSRALIPRQDTEILVEKTLGIAREIKAKNALDLCCGSGCIGIALRRFGGLEVDFVDISEDCLALTKLNAEKNGFTPHALIQSDMFDNVNGTYDIITINPPYLKRQDMENMQTELKFEPALALYGGEDGLDFYKRISRDYKRCLNAGGALVIEIGQGQASNVLALFNGSISYDLCGKERVIIIRE